MADQQWHFLRVYENGIDVSATGPGGRPYYPQWIYTGRQGIAALMTLLTKGGGEPIWVRVVGAEPYSPTVDFATFPHWTTMNYEALRNYAARTSYGGMPKLIFWKVYRRWNVQPWEFLGWFWADGEQMATWCEGVHWRDGCKLLGGDREILVMPTQQGAQHRWKCGLGGPFVA